MDGAKYEQMDHLPLEKRKKALAFSKAMNALAGYSMANETVEEQWRRVFRAGVCRGAAQI